MVLKKTCTNAAVTQRQGACQPERHLPWRHSRCLAILYISSAYCPSNRLTTRHLADFFCEMRSNLPITMLSDWVTNQIWKKRKTWCVDLSCPLLVLILPPRLIWTMKSPLRGIPKKTNQPGLYGNFTINSRIETKQCLKLALVGGFNPFEKH